MKKRKFNYLVVEQWCGDVHAEVPSLKRKVYLSGIKAEEASNEYALKLNKGVNYINQNNVMLAFKESRSYYSVTVVAPNDDVKEYKSRSVLRMGQPC